MQYDQRIYLLANAETAVKLVMVGDVAQRATDDKATLRFKPAGADDRVTQMRAFTRSTPNTKLDTTSTAKLSSIDLVDKTVCSVSTWHSLQVAATLFDRSKQQQLIRQSVASASELVASSVENIAKDNPLMTIRRLFGVGTINNVEFTCSFDTGAATNLLSLHVYNTTPDAAPIALATNQFHTAAGTPLDVIGRALFNFRIANKTTATPFYVVRISLAQLYSVCPT